MPFGRPFRAISLCVSFPGLKPWAVFCSPVGRLEYAQKNVQTPAESREEERHHQHEEQLGDASPTFSKRPNYARKKLRTIADDDSSIRS
jgi:hypothetical protein